jgi:hypothetical protein
MLRRSRYNPRGRGDEIPLSKEFSTAELIIYGTENNQRFIKFILF